MADAAVPVQHAIDLAAAVPHAVSVIIEGADHMMPFSHAAEVEAAVDEFLGALPTAPWFEPRRPWNPFEADRSDGPATVML